MRILSKMAPGITVAAILFLIVRRQMFSRSPLVIAVQVGAVALAFLARRSFAPGQFRVGAPPAGGGIIERGPYRMIRHPMYAAATLLIGSGIVSHWSIINALVGIIFLAGVSSRMALEEQCLRERYPGYAAYARRTKRLVPFVF